MKHRDFEARMRALEYFHGLRLLPGAWAVLRLDGRGFSGFTAPRFEKPFDARFSDLMVGTAQAVLEQFQGVYAYTESDEISVLFAPEWDLFDRELEKLVSLSAALASATFTLACGEVVQFDSRVWLGARAGLVVDYFRWRQTDAARCALNGWCYWTLRKAGQGVGPATAALKGKGMAAKNELLFQQGINFNEVPAWQRRGIGLYWEEYDKEGFNPRTGEKVVARRKRVKIDRELPMKEEYAALLRRIMQAARAGDVQPTESEEG
jgi:tRNA(His) 5'-end guanylyltransferase